MTWGHKKVVYGIYKNRLAVENAIERLQGAGFNNSAISVLMPKTSLADDLIHVKQTKAPEGATVGASTGLVLGGALGWLVGAGALVVTGLAPLVVAGPLVSALAGAGAGGAIGSLAGSLIGLGMPEYEAKNFEGSVREGGILLSVHADDQVLAERAYSVLEETGAEGISISSIRTSEQSPNDDVTLENPEERPANFEQTPHIF